MSVNILGTGMTQFGELWQTSPRELAHEVIHSALKDANIEREKIDAVFVGTMLASVLGNQANIGSLFAEELGVKRPAFAIEAACASGGLALHTAVDSINAGRYETALILGIEKMTDYSQDEVVNGLMAAASDEERQSGITFPGIYALMARAYMEKYHVSEELLATVSVKNHYHGSKNPKAHFQNPITVSDVMKSSKIADPLKLLDCSPISDGAAAVIISSKTAKDTVHISASQVANDTVSLYKRKTFTHIPAAVLAAKKAYAEAGISPMDIDVAEVHDCFSIAEVMANEDVGFSKEGEGAKDISKGRRTLGIGDVVVNPSGGLKACGHPVGATGIKQVVEIVEQLRGRAGQRQVKGTATGLTHNVGGSGAVAVIHILQI